MSGISNNNPIQTPPLQSSEPGPEVRTPLASPIPDGEQATHSGSDQSSAGTFIDIADIFSAGTDAVQLPTSVSPFSNDLDAPDDAQMLEEAFQKYMALSVSTEASGANPTHERAAADRWSIGDLTDLRQNLNVANNMKTAMSKMKIERQQNLPPHLLGNAAQVSPQKLIETKNNRLFNSASELDKKVLRQAYIDNGASAHDVNSPLSENYQALIRYDLQDPAPIFDTNTFEFFKVISDNVANHNAQNKKSGSVKKMLPLNSREMTAVALMSMIKTPDLPHLSVQRVNHKAPRALEHFMQNYNVRWNVMPHALASLHIMPAESREYFSPPSNSQVSRAEKALMKVAMDEVVEHKQFKVNYEFDLLNNSKENLIAIFGVGPEIIEKFIVYLTKVIGYKNALDLKKYSDECIDNEISRMINVIEKYAIEMQNIGDLAETHSEEVINQKIAVLKMRVFDEHFRNNEEYYKSVEDKYYDLFKERLESRKSTHDYLLNSFFKKFDIYLRGEATINSPMFEDPEMILAATNYTLKYMKTYMEKVFEYRRQDLIADTNRCAMQEQADYAASYGMNPSFTRDEFQQKFGERDLNGQTYEDVMAAIMRRAQNTAWAGLNTGNIPEGKLEFPAFASARAVTQHHLIFIGDPQNEDQMVVFDAYLQEILPVSRLEKHLASLSAATGGAELQDFEEILQIPAGTIPSTEALKTVPTLEEIRSSLRPLY